MLLLLLGCPEPLDSAEPDDPQDSPIVDDTDDTDDTGTLEPLVMELVYDRSVTAGNPLKGFAHSYLWGQPVTDFPHSLEFLYLPLSALMDGPDSFTFDAGLEPLLAAAEERGHQVIVRPYIDYPTKESGLPAFLEGQVTMQTYTEFGGGESPDYTDPDLRAAMASFIAAFGAEYDGDPRIAFVQLGLVGFWGEWHTWPHTEWFPSVEIQNEVLNAYASAFPTTHLQVRIPTGDSPSLRMGFHDDSFAYSTIGDTAWFFHPQLVAAGADQRWTEVPIGGELRPELQTTVFQPDYVQGDFAQDFLDCVEQTHASYMLNYGAFGQIYETADEREAAEQGALAMGYEFSLREVRVEDGLATVSVENTGVAPYYYPLELELEGQRQTLSAQPGERVEVSFVVSGRPSDEAPWTVGLVSEHLVEGQNIRLANVAPEDGWLRIR